MVCQNVAQDQLTPGHIGCAARPGGIGGGLLRRLQGQSPVPLHEVVVALPYQIIRPQVLISDAEDTAAAPGGFQNNLLRLGEAAQAVQSVGMVHVDIDAVADGADGVGNSGRLFTACAGFAVAAAFYKIKERHRLIKAHFQGFLYLGPLYQHHCLVQHRSQAAGIPGVLPVGQYQHKAGPQPQVCVVQNAGDLPGLFQQVYCPGAALFLLEHGIGGENPPVALQQRVQFVCVEVFLRQDAQCVLEQVPLFRSKEAHADLLAAHQHHTCSFSSGLKQLQCPAQRAESNSRVAVFHGNGIAQLDPWELIHAFRGLAAELVPVFLQQCRVQLREAEVTQHSGSLFNMTPAELMAEDLHPVLPLQTCGGGQPVLFQQEVLPPNFPGSMIKPGLNHRVQGVGGVQPLGAPNREPFSGQAAQGGTTLPHQPFRQSTGKGCADAELFQALQPFRGPGGSPPCQEISQLRGEAGLFINCPVDRASAISRQMGRHRVQTGNPASADAKSHLAVTGGKAGIGAFQEFLRLIPFQRQGAGPHRRR